MNDVDVPLGRIRLRPFAFWLAVVAAVAVIAVVRASGHTDTAPTVGVTLPFGYRDWRLISVAHEAGGLNDFRAILGNDVAIQAYREGKAPFPDGTMIVRLAWKYVASKENNKVFGREQSFVTGSPINIQLMVKDSRKYAGNGGWGFGQFSDGKPAAQTVLKTCVPCHEHVRARDFVFSHYAP